uniref:Myb-like domain-containing protein n=1 Tax=Kalanchoe fedtschenkoi TaxID=63787 RepID=A0A7N0U0V9_KALFE
MIHTYKRKGTSLNSYSFYERLCGDSVAECSAPTTPIKEHIPNDCYSRKIKEGNCAAWSEGDLLNSSNFLGSPPKERFEAPPIKFKYTRRPKKLCSSGSLRYFAALQLVHESSPQISEMNAMRLDFDKNGCVASESNLSFVDQTNDIPDQDSGPCSGDISSGKQLDNTDKLLGPSENAGSLCHDPCSHDHCINIVTTDATQLNSGSPDLIRCSARSSCSQMANDEKNGFSPDCSNISVKKDSESDSVGGSLMRKQDFEVRNGSDGSSSCELMETKLTASLHTYRRRPRKEADIHRTYVDLLAERSNYVVSDPSFYGCAESLAHEALPKVIERATPETVVEHSPLFFPSVEQLADGNSAIGALKSGQGIEKEMNGCQLIDDANVNEILSLNDEAVTGQQSNDALNSHHDICDLSLQTAYKESSSDAEMKDAFKAALENSQNRSSLQVKGGVASKDFSDKPCKVDCKLTDCEEEAIGLHSEALHYSAERNDDASLPTEAPRADPKQLLEIMTGGITGANGLADYDVQPSEDGGFISRKNKMVYSISLPNGSTNGKVLQLFPEDAPDHALLRSISNSGLVPAVTSNKSSVTMPQPDLSVGYQQLIQDKMFQPSSSHARHKLLLDSIKSWNRPQIEASEGFCHNFMPFMSFWSEEELDNLWVGVRRHGKDNWFAMLRDPKLRFSTWRTPRDLAEKWRMEQTKLLGNTHGPQHQYTNPAGIQMPPPFAPPTPGFMTRFLTDPTQLSLSNAFLDNQGMAPPRPPHNVTNAPGNGTRLFNRRVRAHRRSQDSENTWGRFKARNPVMSRLEFPTPFASTSRNDVAPSCFRDAFDNPHPRPPLPVPPLPLQHSGNLSQSHEELNNKGLRIRGRNCIHTSYTGTDRPGLSFTIPTSQPNEWNPADPKRPKEMINLESDASSEGTISDDGNRTAPNCK